MPSPSATRQLVQRDLLDHIPHGGLKHRRRFELFEDFRQIPLLNASVVPGTEGAPTDAELALRFRANRNFEIGGTGTVADAEQAFDLAGGVLISTDASGAQANDNTFVTPHADTLQSAWAKAGLWGSENEVRLRGQVNLPSIAAMSFRFGLFEDAAQPADIGGIATDDNAVFFQFVPGTTDLVRCIFNIDGVDSTVVSEIALAAATEILFDIEIDQNRIPTMRINGQVIATGSQVLKDAVNFIPQVVIGTETTAAKTMALRWLHGSRAY